MSIENKEKVGNNDDNLEVEDVNISRKVNSSEDSREKELLLDRLAAMIRIISGRKDLKVTTNVDITTALHMQSKGLDAEKDWYLMTIRHPKTGEKIDEYVHIPRQIVESNENVAKGKSAHEAAHAVITRYSEVIPDDVLQQLGFHSLVAALEERSTDQFVRNEFPGAGDWLDEARIDSLNQPSAQPADKSDKDATKLPRFIRLNNLIVYGRFYESTEARADPIISAAYDKIKGFIELVEKSIPKKAGSEALAKAKERYAITYQKIWPHVRALVEEDLEDSRERLKEQKKTIFPSEEALKILQNLEDAILKTLLARLSENLPEDHDTYKKRLAREQTETEAILNSEAKLSALERKKSIYDRTYQEIRYLDEALYLRMEKIFQPTVKQNIDLKSSGTKINLPAVFRWVSGRAGGARIVDNRIFESISKPEKMDYAFLLLNDLSGSMAMFQKIENDFKAKILIAENLNRLGIENEIMGFQDELIPLKKMDERLDEEKRNKISGILKEVWNKNPDGHNRAKFNDDGPCLLEASNILKSSKAKYKYLIILSDGEPAGRRSYERDLINAVDQIIKEGDQILIGIGIGEDTDHVKKFYPISIPNVIAENLPELLGNLLEDTILNTPKYQFQSR